MRLSKPIAQPKGPTRKQVKSRRVRNEKVIEQAVRAACVERDGYCRICRVTGERTNLSDPEWCHLPPYTRAHTRGLPPHLRHSTKWTIMACKIHHDQIDGRMRPRIKVECLTHSGADGRIAVAVDGQTIGEER
jgi:hypothetical protein